MSEKKQPRPDVPIRQNLNNNLLTYIAALNANVVNREFDEQPFRNVVVFVKNQTFANLDTLK